MTASDQWAVAYAATDANDLGVEPGITVTRFPEGSLDEITLATAPCSIPEIDGGQIDEAAADEVLASLGWQRVRPSGNPWTRSGSPIAPGNWGATVEPAAPVTATAEEQK